MFKRKKKSDIIITDKEREVGITEKNVKNFLTTIIDINKDLNKVKKNPYIKEFYIENNTFTVNLYDKESAFILSHDQLILFFSVPVKVITGDRLVIKKWYIEYIISNIDGETKKIKDTLATARDDLYRLSNYKQSLMNYYLTKQEKNNAIQKETKES